MQHQDFYTIPDLAKLIGLSRSQVFRRVKANLIPHQKVGHEYLIPKEYVDSILGEMTVSDQKKIEKAVNRVIRQYGDVIKKLGEQ